MMRSDPIKHDYKAVKFNKFDTQYLLECNLPEDSFLTERVKIEAFQGYSNAYNLSEYFRLRGETSWKKGKQVTGLWKSNFRNVYYGDFKSKKGKTLILFFRSEDLLNLTIYVFPECYYPGTQKINQLIDELIKEK